MNDLAVRVEDLGKRFSLGERVAGYQTLREELARLFRAPWRTKPRRIARLGSRQDEFWALRNVSFVVGKGEIVGIVGRNGAGKSTLLKILSRITPPTEGRAEIHGRIGSLLEVGTGFHPELTGRENVFLSGAILGMRRAEIRRRFEEIVSFAEVERFIDTPVKRFSSGMYLRLAFAVAAHLEPEILLVDEVLAVGDAGFQKRCVGKMGDVARGGRTVLFVSHNMAAVAQLCSSVVWLQEGGVREHGPASQTIARYIAAGAANLAERKWHDAARAPGDDRVRLRACRVVQFGAVAQVLDINRQAEVEIDVDVLRPSRNLIVGASLYDDMGTCLTASCDWSPNSLSPGAYRKRVVLPPQTLAEGTISVLVQCVFFEPDVKSVVLPDAIRVQAADSADPNAVRGHFKGAWPGLVRLNFPWGPFERLDQPPLPPPEPAGKRGPGA